jgi:hypothetical protein
VSSEVFLASASAIVVTLALAAASGWPSRRPILNEQLPIWFAVGLLLGLLCYLVPDGWDSIDTVQELELRFLVASMMILVIANWSARRRGRPGRYLAVAVSSFLGLVTIPIANLLLFFAACSTGSCIS